MATPNGFSSVINACPALQTTVDQAWKTGVGVTDNIPEAEFLTSPTNQRDIAKIIVPGNGKVRTVNVVGHQRMLEENLKVNVANPKCAVTDSYGDVTTPYTLDSTKNISAEDTLNIND